MKKKILYIITKSNLGGAQRYVLELATALPKDHYDVAVACGGNGLLTQKLHSEGITIFPIPSFDRDINLRKELSSIPEIWNIFKKFNPDVVHLNSSKAGGTGALLARFYGVPNIIFTAHGWPFLERRSFLWRSIVWFFSWITSLLAHTVILVSEHDRRKTRMPFVQHKLHVINPSIPQINFVDRESARKKLFKEPEINAHTHDFWLTTVAELTPNKNILSAIQAILEHNTQNPDHKIFYTIIGDGELRNAYKTYIREHDLTMSVCMLGYIDNVRLYLKAFDGFILPSYKEGFPYALLEAQNAGMSVIASNVGGIPEILHGKKEALFNPSSITEITAALRMNTLRNTHRDIPEEKTPLVNKFESMLEKIIELYMQ